MPEMIIRLGFGSSPPRFAIFIFATEDPRPVPARPCPRPERASPAQWSPGLRTSPIRAARCQTDGEPERYPGQAPALPSTRPPFHHLHPGVPGHVIQGCRGGQSSPPKVREPQKSECRRFCSPIEVSPQRSPPFGNCCSQNGNPGEDKKG